jgi:hypothetical protein
MTSARDDGGKAGPRGAEGTDAPAPRRQSLVERAPGRVLSTLMVTPDDELESFRRACLAEHSRADAGRLTMARSVLRAIGQTLIDDAPEQWERLAAARNLLCEGRDSTAPAGLPPELAGWAAMLRGPAVPVAGPRTGRFVTVVVDPEEAGTSANALPFRADEEDGPTLTRSVPPQIRALRADAGDGQTVTLSAPAQLRASRDASEAIPFARRSERASAVRDVPMPTMPGSAADGRPYSLAPESMSVEQFAALCAECAQFPEQTREIERRYGISTPAERRALDERWHRLMAVDPTLQARWRERYDRTAAALRTEPPR